MATHQTHRESSPSQVCIPAIIAAHAAQDFVREPSDAPQPSAEPVRSHQRRTSTSQRVAAAIASWRERARQRQALAQLGPLMLRDLGLSDADVWRETRKSPWQP